MAVTQSKLLSSIFKIREEEKEQALEELTLFEVRVMA